MDHLDGENTTDGPDVSPSGGDPHPHGWHCDPPFIWKPWHPVLVQTPPLAARLASTVAGPWEGWIPAKPAA